MKWLNYSILLSLGVFFWSCDKKDDLLGSNIIEQQEVGLIQFDTIRVEARTIAVDSIPALNSRYSVAGSYVDPVLGKTTGGFYTQLLLPSSNINLGSSITPEDLDSIVLNLKYNGYYGDTLQEQQFKVFEMTETIETTKQDPDNADEEVSVDIFTDQVYATDATALAEKTFAPHPGSTAEDASSSDDFNSLQIRLSDDFGKKIMAASGTADLTDNESFISFMKGLYVVADNPAQNPEEGAMLSFDLLSSDSNMMLYYAGDSIEFKISTSALRVNHYEHDYTGTDVADQIQNKPEQPDLVYLQSLAGTQIILDFPTAHHFVDSSYVINEARLELPVTGEAINYPTFGRVYLKDYKEDDNGDEAYLSVVDRGAEYYDGNFDATTNMFKFNIARHFHKVINEGYSTKLFLRQELSSYGYDMRRAILHGPGQEDKPMRLVLLVSKHE